MCIYIYIYIYIYNSCYYYCYYYYYYQYCYSPSVTQRDPAETRRRCWLVRLAKINYTYIYIYVHTCIYIYMCVYIYVYIYIYICMCYVVYNKLVQQSSRLHQQEFLRHVVVSFLRHMFQTTHDRYGSY